MSEPHLILHRVRGEPAYDIAIKLVVLDEEWWIIPTSGHRAYPHSTIPLSTLRIAIGPSEFGPAEYLSIDFATVLPADWPDHYTVNPAKGSGEKLNIAALVNNLSAPLKDRRF